MSVPDFQTMMSPLLDLLFDGEEHHVHQMYSHIGDHFGLTEEERALRIPSNTTTYLANRVGWALSHLKVAGIVESPSRGRYKITPRGSDFRLRHRNRIDLKALDEFPEHVAFRTPKPKVPEGLAATGISATTQDSSEMPPEEAMSQAYQQLRDSLARELIDRIKQAPPDFFERLVVEVLLAMGYGGSQLDAGRSLGRAGDGGIDGVIREDKLGLDVIYVQAKRWEGVVGRPVVQAFVGAIHGARATKGVVITTSDFTLEAKEYVKTIPTRIVLVDGRTLAELMIDHNVAVSKVSSYDIKKVDSDYFSEL